MRTGLIIITIIIVIILAVAGIFVYQQYQQRNALNDIKITVDGVKVEGVSLSSASLNFTLRITNPSTTAATLDRTDYTVFINNVSLGSGQNLQKVTVPAGGSVVISQPFNVSYSGAAQGVWSYITGGGGEWRMVGTAYFDSFLGTVGVPYNITGTL
ncbi:MAG: LEA type 2 family protein [Methanomassiliicoccus sp.]|nr:LEA type 2 family protein [Methanomassiliicoccus sp.]